MKRIFTLILTLACLLALTSCGTSPTKSPSGSTGSSAPPSAESETSSANTSTPSNTSASSSTESESAPADHPTFVAGKSGSNTFDADDGTTLLTSNYQIWNILYSEENDAQKAIQADLDQVEKDFLNTVEEQRSEVEKSYQEYLKDGGKKAEFPAYELKLSAKPQRTDNGVVSILFYSYSYLGGAHGNLSVFGRSYDAQTGKLLTMKDLGTEAGTTAIENAVRFVNAIQDTDKSFFFDKVTAEDESVQSMLKEGNFYLSEDGLVLIDGQYLLQPYASGIVEFTTSYDDLQGKLTKAYALTGGTTKSNSAMGTYTFDKNGQLTTSPAEYDPNEFPALDDVSVSTNS